MQSLHSISGLFVQASNSQNFKSFINLIKSFLSLYKARYKTESQFDKFRGYSFENGYERERAHLF